MKSEKSERIRVLVFSEHYLPGYRAGGPIRSVAHLVGWLGDEFDFWVFTRDRDMGDVQAYSSVIRDRWVRIGSAHVFYASPTAAMQSISSRVAEVKPDLVYLNGWFSNFSLRTLWLRRIVRLNTPLLLAPRGEFSRGAMSLKAGKKRIYMTLARWGRLSAGVAFHATAGAEIAEIQREVGVKATVFLVPNLPAKRDLASPGGGRPKQPGTVSLVFLSRISPKKNLEFLLELLPDAKGEIHLTIAGPIESEAYAAQLARMAEALPKSIRVTWTGALAGAGIEQCFRQNHFFVLPTLGENYGHAIVEAWAAGLPALLSDRTPWRDLSPDQGGWALPLDDRGAWLRAVQACVDCDAGTYLAWHHGALARARQLHHAPPLDAWRVMLAGAARRLRKEGVVQSLLCQTQGPT